MYYKDVTNGLYYEPSDEVIKENELKEITLEEFNTIKDSINRVDPVLEEKAKAKAYLRDTDWYVTRKMETGVGIPEEVTIKRAEARALI